MRSVGGMSVSMSTSVSLSFSPSSSSFFGRGLISSMITKSALGVSSGSGTFNLASFTPVARFMRTCRPGGRDWSS